MQDRQQYLAKSVKKHRIIESNIQVELDFIEFNKKIIEIAKSTLYKNTCADKILNKLKNVSMKHMQDDRICIKGSKFILRES